MTLIFNLGGHGACRWCGSTCSIRTTTLKFLGLTVRKIWHILCVCVSRPVTLTFDLKTGVQCSTCHGVPPANFCDTTTIRFWFMGHWANTAQTDHVTLWPWPCHSEIWSMMCVSISGPCDLDLWPRRLRGLWLMRVVVLHLCTKREIRRPCHSEVMVHDMCQH